MKINQLTLLTAAIIPLTYLSGNWTKPALAEPLLIKSAFGAVYASALLLLYLVYQKSNNKFQIQKNLTVFVAVLFFVYITISIFWSQNISFFIDSWIRWFAAAVTFALTLVIARSGKNIPNMESKV